MTGGKWRLAGFTAYSFSRALQERQRRLRTETSCTPRLYCACLTHAAAAVLILALCAAPVNAQAVDRPTMFLVMGGDMLALGELTHSEAGIQQGSAREANPLLGGHTNRGGTARRWVLKSAGQAISTYAILRTSRTNPDDPHRRRKIWMARAAAMAKVAFNGYILSRALDYQGDGRDPSGER